MTIQDAKSLLNSAKTNADKKYEIKAYERFSHILTELSKRDLSAEDLQAIESNLDSLNFTPGVDIRTKDIRKALNNFEKFLNKRFSLVTPSYYTTIGIGLGISFGCAFGVIFMNSMGNTSGIGIGIGVGLSLGIAIGYTKDAKAKAEGRVL